MNRRDDNRRGAALVLAVGYVALAGLFAASFLAHWNRSEAVTRRAAWSQTCLNLAEAGVHKALAEHAIDQGYTGETDTPLGDGRFSVTMTPGDGPDAWVITATGELLRGGDVIARRVASARCVIRPGGAVQSLVWEESGS
jgi:hypothetical protein